MTTGLDLMGLLSNAHVVKSFMCQDYAKETLVLTRENSTITVAAVPDLAYVLTIPLRPTAPSVVAITILGMNGKFPVIFVLGWLLQEQPFVVCHTDIRPVYWPITY